MSQMLKERIGAGTVFRYQVIKETLHNPDVGKYRTFGVQVLRETESGWVPGKTISDVSVDRRKAVAFVKSCNERQLDPAYLEQTVEDFVDR